MSETGQIFTRVNVDMSGFTRAGNEGIPIAQALASAIDSALNPALDRIEANSISAGRAVDLLADNNQQLAMTVSAITQLTSLYGDVSVAAATQATAASQRTEEQLGDVQLLLGHVANSYAETGTAAAMSAQMAESQLDDVRLLLSGIDQQLAETAASTQQMLSGIRQAGDAGANGAQRSANRLDEVSIFLNAIDTTLYELAGHLRSAGAAADTALARTSTGLADVSGDVATLLARVEKLEAQLAKVDTKPAQSMGRFSNAVMGVAGAVGTFNPAVGQMVSGMVAAQSVAQATGVSFAAAATGVGVLVAGLAAGKTAFTFVSEGVSLAAEAEQTSIAFRTLIGDADKTKTLLAEIRTYADTTPYKFDELTRSARQLLVEVDSAKIPQVLREIGDVASGVSAPINEVAYVYAQIASQTRAYTQDLNQLATRGIPIYRELAELIAEQGDGTKKTASDVREMAEQGEISFDLIAQVFTKMTDEGGKFYGMTQAQGQSAKGLLSTLEDSWESIERATGAAIVNSEGGKASVSAITKQIASLEPAAEQFGLKLAGAIENALPLAATLVEYMGIAAAYFADVDLEKVGGRPYASPTAGFASKAIGGGSADELASAAAVAKSYSDAAKSLRGMSESAVQGVIKSLPADQAFPYLEKFAKLPSTAENDKLVADLQAAQSRGGEVSKQELLSLQHRMSLLVDNVEGIRGGTQTAVVQGFGPQEEYARVLQASRADLAPAADALRSARLRQVAKDAVAATRAGRSESSVDEVFKPGDAADAIAAQTETPTVSRAQKSDADWPFATPKPKGFVDVVRDHAAADADKKDRIEQITKEEEKRVAGEQRVADLKMQGQIAIARLEGREHDAAMMRIDQQFQQQLRNTNSLEEKKEIAHNRELARRQEEQDFIEQLKRAATDNLDKMFEGATRRPKTRADRVADIQQTQSELNVFRAQSNMEIAKARRAGDMDLARHEYRQKQQGEREILQGGRDRAQEQYGGMMLRNGQDAMSALDTIVRKVVQPVELDVSVDRDQLMATLRAQLLPEVRKLMIEMGSEIRSGIYKGQVRGNLGEMP